ncbi:MAG: RluA family pseudouridine synthase [Deltaproteobacteria bacterium]|nr:RluA family pseudouridine synthase [Deltaproteobacteria bacterium]
MLEFKVTADAAGQRLDKFLRKRLETVPLSHLYKMVRTKKVRVNGARGDIAQLLNEGDVITVRGPEAQLQGPPPSAEFKAGSVHAKARPVQQDFHVIYEDEHLLIVDKPAGMAVHPGSGIEHDTLVDQARAYLERQGLVLQPGEYKPSPAHRLDRETSGVVIVAKTRQAMVKLTEQFTEGVPQKKYLALAKGRFQKDRGTIELRLAEHQQSAQSKSTRGVNMQEAVTHWVRLAGGPESSLLELTIETGRTHQIRRHLAAIGHPVAGDGKHGDFPFNRHVKARYGLKRMFLHSAYLALPHPITGKRLQLQAPLPKELVEALPRAGIEWAPRKP